MFLSRSNPSKILALRLSRCFYQRSFASFPVLRNGECSHSTQVPVISYQDGECTRSEILTTKAPLPSSADSRRAAVPFDHEALSTLPPTMKKFTLSHRIAVITGGSRGLGFNMAQALAEVGVKGIALLDIREDLGDQAAKDLSFQTGVDVRFYKVDVRHADAISQAVEDIVQHFGSIDVVISSAGIADSNIPAETYEPEMFRRLQDINVTGTFLLAQACARKMISLKSRGSMVFIASMSATIVNYPQEQCGYNASKAAVVQLAKSLAAEWAQHSIRVNAISPGYMDTELNRVPALDAQKKIWIDHTPQKRLGHIDELNNLAVFLASDASSYMTGSNCIIDGGYTLW